MSDIQEVYIVAAKRTSVGKAKGVFKVTRPDDLLSETLKAVMQQVPNIPTTQINDVIIGCAMPEAEQGMNVARIAALLAGFPVDVPAVTVNRFCASGLQAISMASDRIALGHADIIIAGGVESMSLVPMGGHHFAANPRYFEEKNRGIAYSMGLTAELVAAKWQIAREAQDLFAYESHQKALQAISGGEFTSQIIPINVSTHTPDLKTNQVIIHHKEIKQDQGPRGDTTLDALAKLKPVFSVKGSVTAGNTSQMSDGAAALVLVSKRVLLEYDLKPLAQLKEYCVAGVKPEHMGIGPIKAIPQVLKRTQLSLKDVGWIELNEAFAAQSLAVIKELSLNIDWVNPLGGAIALGHPLGATGAILATKLIYGARKKNCRYGVVSMCIGTGMGAAGLFEMNQTN